ncbi:NAD(P)-dependent oxidoreductase [Streptomyces sp. NPDC047042]|uniref:NAD(P)-dependent oxidoreductase n=1 Tax=Streptomyces sp. NPDC047042 TaxID=3154807 RepID=UPI00340E4C19
MSTVAVLGAGIMAREIIVHLRATGHRLRLYNRTRARIEELSCAGDELCGSAAEAADGADIVLSFVSDDAAAESVWLGRSGALRTLRPGNYAVECSTLSVQFTDRWADECRVRGVRAVDCALTGSRQRAAEADLIAFAGGPSEHLDDLAPFLGVFCGEIIRFGKVGSGMRYKLVHNLAAASALVGLAEALSLAEACELDPELVVRTLSSWGWAAPVAQSKGRQMAELAFDDVMCSVTNLGKDVAYAAAAGVSLGTSLPLAEKIAEQFSRAVSVGAGAFDMAAVRSAYPAKRNGLNDDAQQQQ